MSSRIADALVRQGLLRPDLAQAALRDSARTGLQPGQIIVERGWVADSLYASVVARELGAERLALGSCRVDPAVVGGLPEEWARTEQMVPIALDSRTADVALLDPENVRGLDELRFRLGRRLRLLVASRGELERLIRHLFSGEPLDRSTREQRISTDVPIDDDTILRGNDAIREAVQSGDVPLGVDPRREALARVVQENRQAAEALRALFDLCVERGIVSREELEARLAEE